MDLAKSGFLKINKGSTGILFFNIALFFLLFVGVEINASAQEVEDTVVNVEKEPGIALEEETRNRNVKDPKIATILSMVLPGAGQVYNEKIWKVPIIYGGIITNTYFVEFNNRRYQEFKRALEIFRDGSDDTPNPFPNLNQDGIIRNVNYWRRNRDANYLTFVVIYALGIVDAIVDAHLSGFDISDDLTLKIEPSYESLSAYGGNNIGVSIKLKF